jgi:two-component system NtrC family sensor kinase
VKFGFRSKIYTGLFSLVLIQGLIIFVWISQVMKTSMIEEIKNRGISTGISLSARIVEPMLAMDFLRMKTLVNETVSLEEDILYTFILDSNGNPLVHTFKDGFPVDLKTVNTVSDTQKGSLKLLDTGEQLIYDYAVPVFITQNRLGTLRFGLLRTRAEKVMNQLFLSAVTTIVLSAVLALVVGTLLLNPVTRSIRRLHESSEKVARGNLDVKAAPALTQNCWDIMACTRTDCPAYQKHHHRCWYLAGTLCPTCVEGMYAKKIESCQQCRVYKRCAGDEIQSLAESFDAMTLSVKENLSDLESARNVLSEQKKLLQTILDAIPDVVTLQDKDGCYISVNQAFCSLLNRERNEIVGKRNSDLFPLARAAEYEQEDLKVLETGEPLKKEIRIQGRQEIKWLHLIKIPVFKSKDNPSGLVVSGRDITQIKAVQDQLNHAQKLESIGRLAAGVAHEINTPLGIILGYAQLLLEDVEADKAVYQDITTIVKQTKICSRIVADLLNFSRSSESKIQRFDIHGVIEDVLDMVEHTFSLNHVDIQKEFSAEPLVVRGDSDKLKQVFINLLNNAFDAIGEHGTIHIQTSRTDDEKDIMISVIDTGHGIAGGDLEKIFDPFYSTKGPDKGTGLGLSVTFGIVREHGGDIKACSPPKSKQAEETGAEFIVRLPMDSTTGKEDDHGKNSGAG